ncbi:inosine triphosphate pyrophosphatase [Plakobranchus ocellatus]|uniref:Inosine triphosphate pyrophosphatase n=1 Tax=Plakobranchus ocellatus TaxID=259542 RepID=A0AAV4AE63_9GAST|nr:inosine triphosphate pyrophosphatase [Plakobranchus ocellatus]
MEKVLKYPLSPVPWSLSSPGGLPLKINKATLLHKLENTFNCFESQDFSRQPYTAYIMDGNALLHCVSSGPDTFKDFAKQASCSLPQTTSVHFVTDIYKPYSKKSCECLRSLHRMLHGFEDKSAYARCIFGYSSGAEDREVHIFDGRCPGKIVEPRGSTNFGWDPVFQPDGHDKTYAEMAAHTKNSISHRSKAIFALRDYLIKEKSG